MKISDKHIDLLDYIRGIAILSVLCFHTLGTNFGFDSLPWNGCIRDFSVPTSFLFFLPLSFGQIGVAVFFIVSGFCIHLSFHQQGQTWHGFFVRRFFRIYPPYFAAVVFCALLIAAHSPPDFHNATIWRVWLTHLFLIHNFDPMAYFGLNGSFWSLAIEAQLYLIYPLLLFIVHKNGWRNTMIMLGGCEFLIRATDGVLQTLNIPNSLVSALINSPFSYWFSWSLGAFIADAFMKNEQLPFAKSITAPWFFLIILSYFIKPFLPFLFPLAALTTAIITSQLLSRKKPLQMPTMLLVGLKKIGLWSYSIYLLHQPLVNIFSYIVVFLVPRESRSALVVFPLLLITWLVVILFSVSWYKIFELPSIAWGKHILRKIDSSSSITFELERLQEIRQSNYRVFPIMMVTLIFIVVGSCWISAKFTPDPPELANNKAWALATDPDPAKRDGMLAVKLAEDACQRTQYRTTTMVGTLAACYAEDGKFDEAVASAQRAIELSIKNGETNLLQKNQELLLLYLNHQPYRESQTNSLGNKN